MFLFYKIEKGRLCEGSGTVLPEGFTQYAEGHEPEDLLEARKPKLEQACLAKLDAINTAYDSVMDYVQAGYPLKEVLSWDVQATEAQELLKNPEAEAVFIRQLATTKGVSVEEMRDRILDNSANWKFVAGLLTAQRQMMEEAVLVAESVEEVEAVKVDFRV